MRAGTFTLEKGAGAVKHAQHRYVSKDNTLDKGTPAYTGLYRAQKCAESRCFENRYRLWAGGPSVRAGT